MVDDPHKSLEPSPTNEAQHASTRLFEPEESMSRQEDDVAFAAELLQSGIVNEREIAAAVSDWSIHGSVSLAQEGTKEQKDMQCGEQKDMQCV
jgi:hypothetical protein